MSVPLRPNACDNTISGYAPSIACNISIVWRAVVYAGAEVGVPRSAWSIVAPVESATLDCYHGGT